jgi:hypothetical protein
MVSRVRMTVEMKMQPTDTTPNNRYEQMYAIKFKYKIAIAYLSVTLCGIGELESQRTVFGIM